MAQGLLDDALHADPVAEADLQLGRMHVHVHVGRQYADVQQQTGTIPRGQGRAIARLGGAHQEGIPEGAPVDEELGAPAGGLRVPGTLGEAGDPERARCV
jgi:hypothetical protein